MRCTLRSACSVHAGTCSAHAVHAQYTCDMCTCDQVLEVEDLNTEENPNSLSIALYKGPEADGLCAGRSGSCTHEQLGAVAPLRITSDARAHLLLWHLFDRDAAVCLQRRVYLLWHLLPLDGRALHHDRCPLPGAARRHLDPISTPSRPHLDPISIPSRSHLDRISIPAQLVLVPML